MKKGILFEEITLTQSIVMILLTAYFLAGLKTSAEPVLFNNQAEFFSTVGRGTTFDFEESSGFPAGGFNPGSPIGLFNGINFDANVIFNNDFSTSGVQVMTGSTGTTGTAILDFNQLPLQLTGFGFFGVGLSSEEKITTTVDFTSGANSNFDVTLNGNPDFTPIFFGFNDDMDSINRLTIAAGDNGGIIPTAWSIDDLTPVIVPEPSSYALMAAVVLSLVLVGYKQKKKTLPHS